jgi:hypothetical protein
MACHYRIRLRRTWLNGEEQREAKEAMGLGGSVRRDRRAKFYVASFPRATWLFAAARRATTQEGGDFVTIATHSHRAPTATARTRGIVEEKPAQGVGAAANGRSGTFDQEFRGGTSNRSEKPVQAAFPADKLKRPGSFLGDKFIVALGHAEDFVDGFNPGGGEGITIHN